MNKKANRQCEDCQLGPDSPFDAKEQKRLATCGTRINCHWKEKLNDIPVTEIQDILSHGGAPTCYEIAKILERTGQQFEPVPMHSYKSMLHMLKPGDTITIAVSSQCATGTIRHTITEQDYQ
jgi:hypothetical protein